MNKTKLLEIAQALNLGSIDDKKARIIAESLQAKCIGTLGILVVAKNKKIITELRPLFK